ncbi:DUF438 domain-containing protein [Olsenella phocaeensis]|uniref:DUF438 domain-containing protein n=1 Tax=Olsenella phocaeensis TaxID=1852385 RepID=UPI003A90A0FE
MNHKLIDLEKTVYELCSELPEFKDVMATLGFDEITKPGRLQTMGRLMTIPRGCKAKGIDLDEVISGLKAAGFSVKGHEDEPGHAPAAEVAEETPEQRQALLTSYLERLGAGEDVEDVREDFALHFANVSGGEIAAAEQALISGGVPVEKVQRLCDVHATLFEGSVSCAPGLSGTDPQDRPGHPVHTLRSENEQILKLIEGLRDDVDLSRAAKGADVVRALAQKLRADADLLAAIFPHYKRKEELLFPHLERHGVTGPSKVMWGKDDEVRELVGDLRQMTEALASSGDAAGLAAAADTLAAACEGAESMVSKEENVLVPLSLETLGASEWTQIAEESGEFGYVLIDEPPAWRASALEIAEERLNAGASAPVPEAPQADGTQKVRLSTGEFSVAQIEAVLNTIPLDLTFVDADDKTRYFSHGDTRAFPRPMSCLGRDVYDCHPPKSQAMVHKVFEDFRSGAKDSFEFWIHRGEQFLYIRYFAVRDEGGRYLGALETTQDIAHIRSLEGENRRGADQRRAEAE